MATYGKNPNITSSFLNLHSQINTCLFVADLWLILLLAEQLIIFVMTEYMRNQKTNKNHKS
jgi:hypothetical protein